MLGGGERQRHRLIGAIDARIIEYQRGAFRRARQADNAAASDPPIGDKGGLRAAVHDRRRPLELRDHVLGIIDLRDDQDLAELRCDRRVVPSRGLRDQRNADVAASDFKAERKTSNRSVAASVGAARFSLPRLPGIGLTVHSRGCVKPEGAPSDGRYEEQDGCDEKTP